MCRSVPVEELKIQIQIYSEEVFLERIFEPDFHKKGIRKSNRGTNRGSDVTYVKR